MEKNKIKSCYTKVRVGSRDLLWYVMKINKRRHQIAPGGRISSIFYTHRTRTSTMFVKKSVKLHSVACQLLKNYVHVAFQVLMIHPNNITVGFSIFQWDSLIQWEMIFIFWKNICQVKNTQYLGYIFVHLYIFSIFFTTYTYYLSALENFTNNFLFGLCTCLSQIH